MKRVFKLGQIVHINGRDHKIVRIWKSGKMRLKDVQYPQMYVILSFHYVEEHGEF